jgi:hypothetical protein
MPAIHPILAVEIASRERRSRAPLRNDLDALVKTDVVLCHPPSSWRSTLTRARAAQSESTHGDL